jgi:hypothetical protein
MDNHIHKKTPWLFCLGILACQTSLSDTTDVSRLREQYEKANWEEKKRLIYQRVLPGLVWDFSLSGIEVESAEVEEHIVLETLPVAVAA